MENSSLNPTLHVEVPFSKNEEANIAYNTLRVDHEPKRSQVVKKLSVIDNKLIIDLVSPDIRQLKHTTATFFDHLTLVQNTIKAFTLPETSS